MAGLRTEAEKRTNLLWIDPRKIKEKPGWNIRDDTPELEEHINRLSRSIAEIGVQEPLKVYMDSDIIYVTNGHCRLKATMSAIVNGAEIKCVPCIPVNRYANEADRVFDMYSSNDGLPITTMEKSNLFKQLIGFGWSEGEIAAKTGLTKTGVIKLLEMQKMPEEMKQLVADGTVTASFALQEYKEVGEGAVAEIKEAAAEINQDVKSSGKKKRVTKKAIRRKKKPAFPEREARRVIQLNTWKYTPEVEDKLLDLCYILEELLVDDNLAKEGDDETAN